MREYPTETELLELEKWDFTKQSLHDFLDRVEGLWNWPDWGFDLNLRAKTLILHTGGWSGNEDIIAALQKNFIFWSMTWEMTRVGGHYTLNLSSLMKDKMVKK